MQIGPEDLSNAKLDVDHIAELATSTAATAMDRKGNLKLTWSGIQETYPDAVTAPALASEAGVPSYAFSAEEAQRIFDNALPLQDYAALRGYADRARSVRITGLYGLANPDGTSGEFHRLDGDVVSADDGEQSLSMPSDADGSDVSMVLSVCFGLAQTDTLRPALRLHSMLSIPRSTA